ncbi:MAG: tRNA (adenosine(37)-N6)-dimethylallyltransferase MiaA [Rickettsiales bacterium]|jgi:tRNA dimethylallyltransferase|nr:tRNA (adenosine(37)-N6)-dimethylallyltransferase MiaA [Rickettsiales bacterium]
MSKKSFIISGPTASGKSDFAHALARRAGGTVINADSVQIYRGLEILSASPLPVTPGEDPGSHQYKLYSIINPGESMSAGIYAELAAKEYDAAAVPIFVGGTGFYLSALTRGFSTLPRISAASRDAARAMENKHSELQKHDPAAAAKLHPNDIQRLSRALEIFIETGIPMSEWQRKPRMAMLSAAPLKIAVMPPREILLERAAKRRGLMLANGAVEEVKKFINMDIQANGFREIAMWLRGEIGKEEMLRLWAISDAQYIKRQMTWLRTQFKADIIIDHVPNEKDFENVCEK